MKSWITIVRRMGLIASFSGIVLWPAPASAQSSEDIRIRAPRGVVEYLQHGAARWQPAAEDTRLEAWDRVRTGTNGAVVITFSGRSDVREAALTELEIQPPDNTDDQPGLHLLRGLYSFFHRDEPGRIKILSSGTKAGIEGTEFVMEVTETNGVAQTTLWVIDGKVSFSNNAAPPLLLTNGQKIVALPGQPPAPPTGFIANNVLQWCFYYPGILDPNDLPLTAAEKNSLAESLAAYRDGDLLDALAKFPGAPAIDAARIYHAALELSSGQIPAALEDLDQLTAQNISGKNQRLAAALRTLVAAVKREPNPSILQPELASELLAASYYAQAQGGPTNLTRALNFARCAVTNSPQFGFGWERVAELEFSFGRTDRAQAALNQAFRYSTNNAQAWALNGFLLAAQNKTREAIASFNRALKVDSSLGNAWLGRGLCKIRRGELKAGREDLLIAAAMEPQRATLRSYLGKAFGDAGDTTRATHELQLAKERDPKDPTAWLYSALLNEQNNQINDAVRDLEESQELNDNRSVYRSGELLDQDRAVRSANLARIYQEAGMDEVAAREASRAVNADYGNYSAHLFLANSFNQLRDPNLINLRYETPTEVEYLLGNLLAPVGAGILSPTLSQQEYSKLFERNHFGVVSETEYLGRGAWTESGSQYGTFNDFSYSVDAFYHSDNGQRVNNDVEQRQISLQIKQQLTPKDSLYAQVIDYDAAGGDLSQYYDQSSANPSFRFSEKQEPSVILGYHREWNPGTHTLFLAARLEDTLSLTNLIEGALLEVVPLNTIAVVDALNMQQVYSGKATIYSTELQQIWQQGDHATIIGGRVQWGEFQTSNLETQPSYLDVAFNDPAADQNFSTDFLRTSFYGYHYWKVMESLQLIGGMSYDRITYPENFLNAPLSGNTETAARVSPKAGLIWTPTKDSTVRFAYTRSLSGASLDESFQLEPSQVAGFIQTYRSIMPESVVGPNAGAQFETFGLSFEKKFRTGTYLGVTGEILNSKVNREIGAFAWPGTPANPAQLSENLDYQEHSIAATLNQLIGRNWSFGARYTLSESQLSDQFPDARTAFFNPAFVTEQKSILQQADVFAVFNHRCGAFARIDALWNQQTNAGMTSDAVASNLPGDNFWQLNIFIGYRSPQRKFEATVGVLNVTGRDYHLNPLTPYNDLARSATAVVRLGFHF